MADFTNNQMNITFKTPLPQIQSLSRCAHKTEEETSYKQQAVSIGTMATPCWTLPKPGVPQLNKIFKIKTTVPVYNSTEETTEQFQNHKENKPTKY